MAAVQLLPVMVKALVTAMPRYIDSIKKYPSSVAFLHTCNQYTLPWRSQCELSQQSPVLAVVHLPDTAVQ